MNRLLRTKGRRDDGKEEIQANDQAEKEEMKQIRKELREKGVIPPVKKRLNRKDYIENTRNKWNEPEEGNSWIYLTRAVSWVMGRVDHKGNVHPEAIGAAKVLQVAMKMQEFTAKLKEEGRDRYTTGELYEYLKETLEE